MSRPRPSAARSLTSGKGFAPVAWTAYASYGPLRARFVESGAHPALLCGAAPAMFALIDEEAEADAIRERMAAAGYDASTVRLLPPWGIDGLSAG